MASGVVYAGQIYKAGDSISVTYVTCAGYLSNNAKDIAFFFPTSKPITASRATISGVVYIRHVGGGYLANGTDISTLGTITPAIKENGIHVNITASSAFSATNNTPLSVTFNGTITFS